MSTDLEGGGTQRLEDERHGSSPEAEKNAQRVNKEGKQPGSDGEPVFRPDTPDAGADNYASLSASEGPCSSIELDMVQEAVRDINLNQGTAAARQNEPRQQEAAAGENGNASAGEVISGKGRDCQGAALNYSQGEGASIGVGNGASRTHEDSANCTDHHESDSAPADSHGHSNAQQSQDNAEQSWQDGSLECTTCKVVATSEQQLASHLEGKKHKRFVAMAELDGREATASQELDEQDLHCDLCDVSIPTPHHKEYHLRGQKHQRRSKQQQLMEASAEIATSSVDVLLGDEEHDSAPLPPANVPPASGALMQHNSVPLRSPFEAFEPSQPQPQPFSPIPSQGPLGGKTVRFSGNLESFIKEPEAGVSDGDDEAGTSSPAPVSLPSGGSYKLMSGGSFSSPAAHFCPVCGIIATSEANLQDHLRGRRHARRLQYLSHMPEEERNNQLQRTMTAGSGMFRQGSLVLPSSMDLTQYLGRVVQVQHMPGSSSERVPTQQSKPPGGQVQSHGSTSSLELHPEQDESSAQAASVAEGDGSGSGVDPEADPLEDKMPKVQPRCEICGITTTSEAHMEAHVAGRKHRRRVEANMGRGTIKQSPHYCALCDISTTSAAHLALHLVGRAHRRRQKAMEDSDFPHLLPARAVAQRGDMELLENAIADGSKEHSGDAEGSVEDKIAEAMRDAAPSSNSELDLGKNTQRRERRPPLPENRQPRSSQPWGLGPQDFQGLQMQHPGAHAMQPKGPMPMGMYPYPPSMYTAGSPVPQMVPGSGNPAMYGWWPHLAGHQLPQQHGYDKGMYQHSAPMPAPHFLPGNPNPYGMMLAQGQLPGASVSHPMHHAPLMAGAQMWPGADMRDGGQAGWGTSSHAAAYACEVCNVETDKLDDLKQHLRGKQHMRRLHNQKHRGE